MDRLAALKQGREAAKSWSDDRVAAAVRRFVLELAHTDDDEDDLWCCLQQQPAAAAGHASRLLTDSALRQRLLQLSGGRRASPGRWESPAQRACSLLGEHACPEAIPALLDLLAQPHDDTRKEAALALGRTGAAAAFDGVCRALRDEDRYVRSYAVIGLRRAATAGQLDPTARDRLLAPLLDAALTHDHDGAAIAAAMLDHTAALAAFRDAGALARGAPPKRMFLALVALAAAPTPLPRAELLELWRDRPVTREYPASNCRAVIVRMLAAHGHPDDDALLHDLVRSGGDVAADAATALAARAGIGRLDEALHRKRFVDRLPFSPAERRHVAMRMLDAEVLNGGFSQFFANSSGDDWDAAVEGFTAHDAQRAALLREGLARFAEPPSLDRDTRLLQLAQLAPHEAPFADLDVRYARTAPAIEVVLLHHALAHAAELRGLR